MAVVSNGTTLIDNGALDAAVPTGSLTLLSTQTASASATISFTSGIDSTYDKYVFKFYDIHASTDAINFTFQADTGTNTSYNQIITSTIFQAYNNEAGGSTGLDYLGSHDQAQGTAFQNLTVNTGNGNDESVSGYLEIYNPSSSVFVKHFIARINSYNANDFTSDYYTAGYFNLTTALTRFQFKMSSGNIDSGVIKLYGVA